MLNVSVYICIYASISRPKGRLIFGRITYIPVMVNM
ncbi:hypothetical protein M6B38_393455 [Iris pallida]|uniref:Uncharacterized protein n=1 Tax=Iris pallida TaxID=29817 RepID=A0AAX6FYR5_IRIPA|nr:hypothetical protein M6B38_393455 [Iris pallida]